MVVIFGQSHDVTFRGEFESTAARYLHLGAMEVGDELASVVEDGDVELKEIIRSIAFSGKSFFVSDKPRNNILR